MIRVAARLQPVWPILAIGASLVMLAAAHAFQRFGGFAPCPLCLKQRDVYWGAVALAAVGFALLRFWPSVTLRRAIAVLIGLAFLTGAIVALYHVAVEQHWVVATCDVNDVGPLAPFDVNATFVTPKCDEIAWSMFGVSMAGWNALISMLLAATSFVVASAPSQTVEEA
jgi:disulfide bond formation protein DsbB